MDYDDPISAIRPSSPSLEAQLQALDLLAARVQTLTNATRWPARVPLNSKATFEGQIVHTNDVNVNIGGGYWVAMTAGEAADWVKRRKQEMLLEHVRRVEGSNSAVLSLSQPRAESRPNGPSTSIARPIPIHLNPTFSYATAGPSRPQTDAPPAQLPTGQTTGRLDPIAQPQSGVEGEDEDEEAQQSERPKAEQDLKDVIGDFMNTQRLQAASSGAATTGEAITNEEGVPIHEIMEDLDGNTLGDPPAPTTSNMPPTRANSQSADDYWSEAAKARRAALRRNVFNEGSDSESELEASTSTRPAGVLQPPSQVPPVPPTAITPSSTQADAGPSSPHQAISPSTSTPAQPKSILKPQSRKKSVTFDDSVPMPPDSPQTTIKAGKVGFPMPVHDVSDGREYGQFDPAPVPMLNQPLAPKRKDAGFAGFKPGFLALAQPTPSTTSASSTAVSTDISKPKTSLFAQRMATKADASKADVVLSAHAPVASSSKGSNLPKLSASQQMASMKNAVIEKAPVAPSPPASSSKQTALGVIAPRETDTSSYSLDEVEDEIDDDNDDDEDEYELDDALLAREVALDYHRRQRPPRHRSESDEEYGDPSFEPDDDGEGGVMLALPSVSNGKIVNPTPDELRKYVRVGRLENGNLVLAPGEKGWSDDEDGEAKANREQIRRQLLGQSVTTSGPAQRVLAPPSPKEVQENGRRAIDPGLPPTVRAVVENKPAAQAGEEPREMPQKISRFKAARLGWDE